MFAAILITLALVASASADAEIIQDVYRWCGADARCAASYHIDADKGEQNLALFNYLVHLRVRRDDVNLDTALARKFGFGVEDIGKLSSEALHAHWLVMLVASVPSVCDDVLPDDIGVQCAGDDAELRFDSARGVAHCVRRAAQAVRAQRVSSAIVHSEHWHTPLRTAVAVMMLVAVFSVYLIAKCAMYTRRMRSKSRRRN